jgi:hypothetical protein
MGRKGILTVSCILFVSFSCLAQIGEIPIGNLKDSVNNSANKISAVNIPSTNLSQQDSVSKGLKISDHTAAVNNNINKYQSNINKKDSSLQNLKNLPAKYFDQEDAKMDKYTTNVNTATVKVLQKLSRLENKVKPILEETNPAAADRLFGNGQMTFGTLLQKIQNGDSITMNYRTQYNAYNDSLTTKLKYIEQQKSSLNASLVQPAIDANKKADELDKADDNSAAVQQFIKDRKAQLIQGSFQYIGNCKYLNSMDQESWYYVQTIKNYKETLSDPNKSEQTAMGLLNKIPAFQKYMNQNSQLCSLFGLSAGGDGSDTDSTGQDSGIAGLQTRAAVQNLLQTKMPAGSAPNAGAQSITGSAQQAQQQLSQLKDNANSSGSGGNSDVPNFKPNTQKTKTFLKRIEYGANIQFERNNSLLPAVADIAFTVGYKLNDNNTIGVGVSYNIGLGSISDINITQQGLGLRSFIDCKLKKQIYATGGFEMNYSTQFQSIYQLKNTPSAWQQSGLIGLKKKMNIQTSFFKSTDVEILYDMLYRQHVPISQPFLFRAGYSF